MSKEVKILKNFKKDSDGEGIWQRLLEKLRPKIYLASMHSNERSPIFAINSY
jgi:hypothetical protein